VRLKSKENGKKRQFRLGGHLISLILPFSPVEILAQLLSR
jgi:hypothetical protein